MIIIHKHATSVIAYRSPALRPWHLDLFPAAASTHTASISASASVSQIRQCHGGKMFCRFQWVGTDDKFNYFVRLCPDVASVNLCPTSRMTTMFAFIRRLTAVRRLFKTALQTDNNNPQQLQRQIARPQRPTLFCPDRITYVIYLSSKPELDAVVNSYVYSRRVLDTRPPLRYGVCVYMCVRLGAWHGMHGLPQQPHHFTPRCPATPHN